MAESNRDRETTEAGWTQRSVTVPPEYLSLHKYLKNRYADIVVLRFREIEDLLGFSLPEVARVQPSWWAAADGDAIPSAQSRSWTQAERIATANLRAQSVAFERRRT